jgi:o-succinylbenzoate synthase
VSTLSPEVALNEARLHRVRALGRTALIAEGANGWGECSPLPGYPCTFASALTAALEAARRPWPEARRQILAVNALVGSSVLDPARLAGFSCVKVKVGRSDLRSDVALVATVRDAVGPRVSLRVDANGAWDEETAADALRALSRYDLELAEQPVPGIDALGRLRRRTTVALAADECIRSVEDAKRLRSLDAADVVVLKVQPLGGVEAALRVADAAGCPALVTSMMETSVGMAVSAALAAALPGSDYAHGLATLGPASDDVTTESLVAKQGTLPVRRVVPDPGRLQELATDLPCHGEMR